MNRFSINSKKFYGFTLIELVLVMVIIGIIVPIMLNIYRFIITSNKEISARYETIQQGYEFFERLNILMQDYTVDYEEYYNRQMVGCSEGKPDFGTGVNFKWNVGLSGYCSNFTAYGNYNSTSKRTTNGTIDTGYHDIYHCTTISDGEQCRGTKLKYGNPAVYKDECGRVGSWQSFGQYAALFKDVKNDADDNENSVGDSDDRNLGKTVKNNINAIKDSDNIQELYFISHDGKSRLYFRRKLVKSQGKYAQYKIQMIRLRGFDAGQKHNFGETTKNDGLYDGQIDTWACDAGMGFIGQGQSISGAYADYRLPKDEDDCWMDLTRGSTSVLSRKIAISPTTDSELAWAEDNRQINAYTKILIVNGIYLPYYGSLTDSAGDFKVPLQTTINMKDFYRN